MIRDRVLLGVVAGAIGSVAKFAVDEVSLRLKISQRSFRSTAAGVWLPSKSQAGSPKGQLLGAIFDLGQGLLGGVGIVYLLTATGKDQIVVKGATSGIALGSGITAIMSGFPTNKVSPKDAASNLSYMLAHAVYGLVTTAVAARLGDDTLFKEISPTTSSMVEMVATNVV